MYGLWNAYLIGWYRNECQSIGTVAGFMVLKSKCTLPRPAQVRFIKKTATL